MKKKSQKINLLIILLLSATFSFGQDIVINEINYKSAGDFDTKDWVELYNNEAVAVDISNWVFKDEDDLHEFFIPNGTIINPNTYLVLTQELAEFQTFFPSVSPVLGDLGFGFSGNSELLRLFDNAGLLVDEVTYDDEAPWPTEPDGDGNSLELILASLDNVVATSWAASNTSTAPHGTPGEQNSVFDATASVSDNKLNLLAFSIFPNPMQNETTINIADEYSISSGKITIFNILGKAVRSFPIHSNIIAINRGNLTAGVYIVNLTDNKTFLGSKKLIVR